MNCRVVFIEYFKLHSAGLFQIIIYHAAFIFMCQEVVFTKALFHWFMAIFLYVKTMPYHRFSVKEHMRNYFKITLQGMYNFFFCSLDIDKLLSNLFIAMDLYLADSNK